MSRKFPLLAISLFCCCLTCFSQERYYTRTGRISFLSNAPLEDIEAVNKTVAAILDATAGSLQFAVQMRGFEFRKALMQEHFNENYVESQKYPRAEFKGSILNNKEVSYEKSGVYQVNVKGQLTIHGITKELTVPATLTVNGNQIAGDASFFILLSDYAISIPSLVKDKISNRVKITIAVKLDPLKK